MAEERDLRRWIKLLEDQHEIKHVTAEVDWNGEISEIMRRVYKARGPAVLFENIKDYHNTWSRKLMVGGLSSRKRIALMMGMPKESSHADLVQLLRKRLREPIKPIVVPGGPVKENIARGDQVDLFQFPVPQWHEKDGGRYINSWCSVVTADPETGETNVGMYRGMIVGKNKISVFLIPAQGWGNHFSKYQQMGKPMPVAVVYGWDEALAFMAATPFTGAPEYEVTGAIIREPVRLVKCETSDLLVPASAEIVVEGTISPDTKTYEIEGPYCEFSGYYGQAAKRPVVKVDCVTYRNDPIFRGALESMKPGSPNETAATTFIAQSAVIWDILTQQGIPGVLEVIPAPWTVIRIHKTYQGQPRQIAAALWGSRLTVNICKTVMVVEEDANVHDLLGLQAAWQSNLDPARGILVFPEQVGSGLDISLSSQSRMELSYGAGLQNKVLIDATIDWTTHPLREEFGNRRLPLTGTVSPPEMVALADQRWQEYGL